MADFSLKYLLLGEDRSASKAMKHVGESADHAGSKIDGMSKRGAAGAVALGTAMGGIALEGIHMLVGGIGDMVAGAREQEATMGRINQVIKTTGGAAHVTASSVDELATSISNKTGIDDDAIKSSAALMLTFTGVQNAAGKGNDIFNQATQAVTDMSVALGQDAKSSTIQLGKALNDPIKGITALSRVGVSFTAQQKAQIKTLVKSGDTLGAQKIILKELGKEFGGAAAASTNPMQKLQVTLGTPHLQRVREQGRRREAEGHARDGRQQALA